MIVNKVVETDTGSIKFDGELSPEETQLVIEIGLNFLVRAGAFNRGTPVPAKDAH
jgi:hypothetical protein